MKRRTLIKNVLFFSAGAVLMPSCVQPDNKATIPLNNIHLNGDEEKLVSELAEFILPTTTTPGAMKLASHQYILMMVDECMKKEDQEKFTKGLKQFNEFAKTKTGDTFTKADQAKRTQLLKAIESKKDIPGDILSFYTMAKRLTIQSFTGSKYYLTEVRKYEMVPGRFHGCFPVAG